MLFRSGVAPKASPPLEFSPDKNVAWKAPLPGRGCSTPVVWEDKIYLTCSIDGKDGVMAFDMKGKELWRETLGREVPPRHRNAGSGERKSVE